MSTLTSSLVVQLIDRATGPAKAITNSINAMNRAGLNNAAPSFSDKWAADGARISAAIDRNNRALDVARGRLIDAVGGIYLLKRGMEATVGPAVSFESAMADIAKVSGFDDPGLAAYGKRLRRLAVTDIPMAIEELAALSAAAAQAGVPDEDLFDFTSMTAEAAVAWEMAGGIAGENLAKIRAQLGLTTEETKLFADAINHLSNNSATNAADLVDFAKRVSAQGEFFGFAKEQTLAFGTAMIGAGNTADVSATSFRNMGRALTRGASATKRQASAFKTLGLNAVEVAKRMQKDAVGTTIEVIERLGKLPEEIRATTMSDLFGDEARALAPLLNDLDKLREALGLVADKTEYAGSVNQEFTRRAETAQYAMQRFKNQLRDIGITLGSALIPALKDIMEVIGPLAIKLSDLAGAYPQVTSAVVGTIAAMVGLRVATSALTFAGLLGKGGALSMLAGGLRAITFLGTPIARFFETLRMRSALATASMGRAPGIMARIGDAALVLVRSVPGLGLVGKALATMGAAMAGISAPAWGTIAAVVAAIAAAGALLWKYWDRVSSVLGGVARRIGEEFQPALEALSPALDLLKPVVQNFTNSFRLLGDGFAWASQKIGEFMSWLGSFFEQEVLTEAQKAEWEKSGYDAADRIIQSIKRGLGGAATFLFEAGAEMMRAVLAGIKSAAQAILDYVSSLGSQIAARITGAVRGALGRLGSYVGLGGGAEAAPAPSAHRAKGGPVWPGSSFLVGENEPEVFTPRTGGEITPLADIREAIARMGERASDIPPSAQQGRSISLSIGKIVVEEAKDAQATARAVRDILSKEIESLISGSFSDMEARY